MMSSTATTCPPPPPPPPPGYSPYPPPHPAYYYPYPYPPPPPYPHHQYAPMPPLQAPPTSSTTTTTSAANSTTSAPTTPAVSPPQKKTKRPTKAATKSKRSQTPPKIVSSTVETQNVASNVPEDKESSAGTATKGTIIPHENDVLMGRGGKNNTHIGNEKLREMARAMREVYIVSRKKVKTNMARQLVQQVFALNPPGRFLQRDPVTMIWEEVDLDTARHKTSQCLRDAASEKSSYTKISNKPAASNEEEEEDITAPLPMETVESGTPTMTVIDRPATPIEQISSSPSMNSGEDDIKRALTPVLSNTAHKIEPSPPQQQQLIEDSPTRNRIESWESANFARNLIEAWEDNNGSFQLLGRNPVPPRRGSMDISCGSSSHHRRMYTWMSANSDMEMEDAVLIPPEELDAVEDGDEFFSLLDDSPELESTEDEEMQIWQPEMYGESGSPFDTDFFY